MPRYVWTTYLYSTGSSTKVLVQSILAIAFAEAIVFYTLFLVR